jgi:hypothetical protein
VLSVLRAQGPGAGPGRRLLLCCPLLPSAAPAPLLPSAALAPLLLSLAYLMHALCAQGTPTRTSTDPYVTLMRRTGVSNCLSHLSPSFPSQLLRLSIVPASFSPPCMHANVHTLPEQAPRPPLLPPASDKYRNAWICGTPVGPSHTQSCPLIE